MKHRFTVSLICAILSLPLPAVAGEPWQGKLDDGSVIHVDPSTNRTTVTSPEGVTTPIWDGVHRLQDGSTVTTNNGIIVPTEQIWHSRQPVPPKPIEVSTEPSSECLMLEEAVCGPSNACADDEPCRLARQLLKFDQEEAVDINAGVVMSDRSMPGQCRQAFRDSKTFPPCKR